MDEPGVGNLLLLPGNKGWGTFLTSALGQVPFPPAFIVLGKACRSEGSRDQNPPRNNKIFNSDKKSGGGAGRFSVDFSPFWCFEGTFSVMLRTSDKGGGRNFEGA